MYNQVNELVGNLILKRIHASVARKNYHTILHVVWCWYARSLYLLLLLFYKYVARCSFGINACVIVNVYASRVGVRCVYLVIKLYWALLPHAHISCAVCAHFDRISTLQSATLTCTNMLWILASPKCDRCDSNWEACKFIEIRNKHTWRTHARTDHTHTEYVLQDRCVTVSCRRFTTPAQLWLYFLLFYFSSFKN